jgi:mRNA interferase MazF
MRDTIFFGEIWIQDWKAGGLLKPSVVKPVFATLERSLVIRRLGALTAADKDAVRQAIALILG